MKRNHQLIILLSSFLLCSCRHIDKLYSDLSGFKPTLGYLYEKSNPPYCAFKHTVNIKLDGLGLARETVISKTGVIVVPLVIFNLATTKAVITLGQNDLSNDYNKFFINSINEQSQRDGCFVTGNNESDSSYVLYINLNNILVNSDVKRGNYFVLLPLRTLAWGSFTQIKEAECRMSFEARLTKNSNLIYLKEYTIKKKQPLLYLPNDNSEKISVLKDNLAECLSLSTKELIDQLVEDISHVIEKQ